MAKGAKTVFVCGECGYESSKWLGRCPNCESWNTFVESAPVQQIKKGISSQRALPLREVQADAARRIPSGIGELDRVLGGGIVGGSAVLLGGDPGIGKSTLLMQMARSPIRAAYYMLRAKNPRLSSSCAHKGWARAETCCCLRKRT